MNSNIRRHSDSELRYEVALTLETWVADLTTKQDSAVGSRIAKNAEFNDQMAQLIALKSTATHMVPNFCSTNPGAIAAWHSAAHVEAPPKKKVPPTPPTP